MTKGVVQCSPHRRQIDERLLRGDSPRQVSAWLLTLKNPEKISHATLNTYRKRFLDIDADVVQEYQKRVEEKENRVTNKIRNEEISARVDTVCALDGVIAEGDKIELGLDDITPDEDTTELDIINAKIKAKRIMIQAVKVRHEILKDDPAPVVNLFINDNLLDTLINRRNENKGT